MAFTVVLLHVLGWGVLLLAVAPQHLAIGATGFYGAGLGMTAYTLGVRHAFDADHIAAIDNITRKLIDDDKKPVSVGFFFALGHSTIVLALTMLLATGVHRLASSVTNTHSLLHTVTGTTGTIVSGVFLYIIAAINLNTLFRILSAFRQVKQGAPDGHVTTQLHSTGPLHKLLGRVERVLYKEWHMYPLGMLFGLGFDTATEVALLFVAAGAAGSHLPWFAILVLPVLFAAGMTLFDTVDGWFMNVAYGWALSNPLRKLSYNLVITTVSVVVAFLVGTVELGGTFSSLISKVDLTYAGYALMAIALLVWLVGVTAWKFARPAASS